MRKVKIGVVGCGWAIRDLYAPAFRRLRNGELVAAMDIDKARVLKVKELYGVPHVYTRLKDILEDEVEAVMVTTPTQHHAPIVVEAAKAGKHVYCEKPMARTIEEADAMISACKENGVKLMVAFMKRFNKSYQLVKEVIESGRLGDIFEARAVWDNARATASAKAGYRHSLEAGGGFLQEDGSHPIDLLRWWLGDVDEVTGHVMIVSSDRVENEDVGCVMLKHKSGALSTLHITMLTHCVGEERYEVFGTKGTLVMRWLYHSTHSIEPGLIYLYERSKTVTDLTPSTSWNPDEELSTSWQFLKELEHFCDCILEDKTPLVTGVDGRAVVEIINAAYLSSWRRIRVHLPLTQSPNLEKIFTELKASSKWRLGEELWRSRY